jgi:peroxin-19
MPGGGAAGPGGAGDFSGLLDGMMKQLMTKEILEEPLAELGEKVRVPRRHV